MQPDSIIATVSVWVLPVLLAITLHEAAHGWAAWQLGDDTAKRQGRVTFNPLRHIDPVGTVIVPALLVLTRAPLLFGWAKPVPVNFGRLRQPRRDMVLVAAAGPAANLLLALASVLLFHVVPWLPRSVGLWLAESAANSLQLNLILAVFNMLPMPPLDGGRVAVGLLPRSLALPLARLERYGFLIILGALFLLPMLSRRLGYDINPLAWLIGEPVRFLGRALLTLAGLSG